MNPLREVGSSLRNSAPMGPAAIFAWVRRIWASALRLWRFGKDEVPSYDWFLPSEVSRYWSLRCRAGDDPHVDEQTWDDLLGEQYMRQVAGGMSILGRQLMFARLRGAGPSGGCAELQAIVLSRHERFDALAAEVHSDTAGLRTVSTEFSGAIFGHDRPELPQWSRWLWLVPAVGLFGVLLVIQSPLPLLGWALVCLYVAVGVFAAVKLGPKLRQWHQLRRSVLAMLDSCAKLERTASRNAISLPKSDFASSSAVHAASRALRPSAVEAVPGVVAYANLFVLYEYLLAWRLRSAFEALIPILQSAFEIVAEVESAFAVASHLRRWSGSVAPVARPERGTLRFVDMVNPLVPEPEPLDIEIRPGQRGLYVTGPNGVGKSTFLRAIGLNVLTAKAFGFCYAASASIPSFVVMSSLHNEDSLADGLSSYMAELRRAEEMLCLSSATEDALLLFDEVFRGTNHLDSTAAAAALVQAATHRSLVVVSSHNLLLGQLMRSCLVPVLLQRCSTSGGRLQLRAGFSVDSNGVHLMRSYKFPSQVVDKAVEVRAILCAFEMNHSIVVPMSSGDAVAGNDA